MKLHALDRVGAVAQSHNQAIGCFSGNLQLCWQRLAFNDQAVIAISLERRREAAQDSLTVMINQRRFSMHRRGRANDPSAVDLTDSLVAQADAQQGDTGSEMPDDCAGEAGLVGCARARRDHDTLRLHLLNSLQRYLIVATHLNLRAQFSKVLVEIVRKAIVVIDE